MKRSTLVILFLLFALCSKAQITFSEAIGGDSTDQAIFGEPTFDGGYIVVGWTKSYGAGFWDIYLVKTDANGSLQWTKTYGGPGGEVDCFVQQTHDSGYVITARTNSYGVGSTDVYLIKTDSHGNAEWTKTVGGTAYEEGHSVLQTSDRGYIHTGYTNSFGAGADDVYLIKNDSMGNTQWAKTYGGGAIDHGHLIRQAVNGGYIIIGESNSFGAGDFDMYLLRLDANGNFVWSKTFGGSGDEHGWDLQVTSDNQYIITGYTASFNGGNNSVYLLKTDTLGNILWSKIYNNAGQNMSAYAMQEINGGGFVLAGETSPTGVDVADVLLLCTDANGVLQWSKTYGGSGDDGCQSVQKTADGGYFISGYTNSTGAGDWDFYIIKTDAAGNTAGCTTQCPAISVTTPATAFGTPATQMNGGAVTMSPAPVSYSGGAVALCQATGIETNSKQSGIVASPNPFSSTTTIRLDPSFDHIQFVLFDMLGNEVLRRDAQNGTEINREGLTDGVYLYKAIQGARTVGAGKLVLTSN